MPVKPFSVSRSAAGVRSVPHSAPEDPAASEPILPDDAGLSDDAGLPDDSLIPEERPEREPPVRAGAAPLPQAPRGLWVLAFFLPFGLLGLAFAVHGVYPFGTRQILVTDFWQQYYALFCELRRKLVSGDSLLYSWNSGLGVNFTGLIGYYLASPLNLLLLLIPERLLREGLTLLLLIKTGAAGICACWGLRRVFGAKEGHAGYAPAFFGAMYALCAFTLGYYWNLIWFDAFALAPLAIAAAVLLVREGKPGLYLISLALCVFVNYYIGYGVCLFIFLLFFAVCFAENLSLQLFLRRLVTIAAASVLAVALTAVLTLPALLALRLTYSSFSPFPAFSLYESFADILGNFLSFTPPTPKVGLPNLASSVLCFPLLLPYAFCRRIPLRERIAGCALFVFLVLSCGISCLNFIWHGFHTTNMIPYRFSYLATLTLIALAYRYFTVQDGLPVRDLPFFIVSGVGFAACGLFGAQETSAVLLSVLLCALYALFLILYRAPQTRRTAAIVLALLIMLELGANSVIGVRTVQTTDRNSYPAAADDVRILLDTVPDGFCRVETAARFSYNDPLLYGYRGVGLFSSTANVSVTRFVESLGLHGWDAGNRYVYAETSPLTDVFLGLRYLICLSGEIHDTAHRSLIRTSGSSSLYRNDFALSPAFMTSPELADYAARSADPFENQNALFRAATGLDEDLFVTVDVLNTSAAGYTLTRKDAARFSFASDGSQGSCSLRWNFLLPDAGTYYAYTDVNHINYVHVIEGDSSWWYEQARPYVFCMGEFTRGETVSLFANIDPGLSGSACVRVRRLNEGALTRGLARLAASQMEITEYDSGRLSGTVKAREDGLLYLSVPADPGWRARVDGKAAGFVTVDGAMLALPLSAGEHTVELVYRPAGFTAGLLISLAAAAAAVWWFLPERFRHRGKLT